LPPSFVSLRGTSLPVPSLDNAIRCRHRLNGPGSARTPGALARSGPGYPVRPTRRHVPALRLYASGESERLHVSGPFAASVGLRIDLKRSASELPQLASRGAGDSGASLVRPRSRLSMTGVSRLIAGKLCRWALRALLLEVRRRHDPISNLAVTNTSECEKCQAAQHQRPDQSSLQP
jgi:hypothetical protein